tara:strand:- start:229 stop:423 length:195 start_codon:yes stop_codon:yes gene_type:complete
MADSENQDTDEADRQYVELEDQLNEYKKMTEVLKSAIRPLVEIDEDRIRKIVKEELKILFGTLT